MKNVIILFLFCMIPFFLNGQCDNTVKGIIWKNHDPFISFKDLALHAAPMLWFSPDEILLYDEQGQKQLPNAFPFEKGKNPVVYYKIRHIYSQEPKTTIDNKESNQQDFKILDLSKVKAIDLDYYYYFEKETGLGSHPHDIESITLQIRIIENTNCPDYKYAVTVQKVIARAHGLHWYNNALEVDAQTFFPLSILIEEGKHASCTDKNADGVYTPGYDITERINDAWGVRDIITGGRLVTGGFEAWMAKNRTPNSILFPPLPTTSPYYKKYIQKFEAYIQKEPPYELRPYPEYPVEEIDKKLKKLMLGKKPHKWPKIIRASGKAIVQQWVKEDKAYNALSFAYRWDDARGLSVALPLLIVRNVEAPMTGGWLFHKLSFGNFNSTLTDSSFVSEKLLGHQIVHTSSASKWIDSYIGLGYEIYDDDFSADVTKAKWHFVSEAGIKIRVNISKTPLKFLKYLGTDFWGLRLGWKNVGFSHFRSGGFVVEFGAGVF